MDQAVHGAVRFPVLPAFVHPLGVVLAADVYALLFLPAAPVILAAAHGIELIVGELEARLLGELQQLLGALRVLQLLLELGVSKNARP